MSAEQSSKLNRDNSSTVKTVKKCLCETCKPKNEDDFWWRDPWDCYEPTPSAILHHMMANNCKK